MHKAVLSDASLASLGRGRCAKGRDGITTMFAALLIFVLGQAAGASPGNLDPSFDADGLVLTHFGRIDDDSTVGQSSESASSIVVQPDGKLVVAGSVGTFDAGDFALARYNSDGSLDASFGSGGRVLTDFEGSDSAFQLVLQPGGKLLAGGRSFRPSTDPFSFTISFALARYNPDGSLDASFGSGGQVQFNDFSLTEFSSSLLAAPDGKLVALGSIGIDEEFNSIDALMRLDPEGRRDQSFGSGGIVTGFDGDLGLFLSLHSLVVQPDGKPVVAGTFVRGFFPDEVGGIFLARFDQNGNLDANFGSGGRVFTEGTSSTTGLVLQPDGKLVASGLSFENRRTPIDLVRYNPDGSLDASFGAGGRAITDAGGFELVGPVLHPNGEFFMRGFRASGGFETGFALARFNADGSLDATFGSGGLVITNFSGRFDSFRSNVRGLVIQPDGKLVAAGTSDVSGPLRFCRGPLLGHKRAAQAASEVWRPPGHDARNIRQRYPPGHLLR